MNHARTLDGELFHKPFGPGFLYNKLEDSTRIKLFNCIEGIRNSSRTKAGTIYHDPANLTDPSAPQEATISNGEMKPIAQIDDKQHGDGIIKKTLLDLIKRYARLWFDNSGFPDMDLSAGFKFALSSVWYVVMKEGDFHVVHSHQIEEIPPKRFTNLALLSGGVYLQCPENPYPQGAIHWIQDVNDGNNFVEASKMAVQPKAGECYVWPSEVNHTVYPFRGPEERIMISFNGFWDRLPEHPTYSKAMSMEF